MPICIHCGITIEELRRNRSKYPIDADEFNYGERKPTNKMCCNHEASGYVHVFDESD